ncbi:MAG: hypothetical protein RLN83_14925 [Balneola sp.]
MSSFDPFHIEKRFNETLRLIQSSASERVQISYIYQFLLEIQDFKEQADSYSTQLFEKLPELTNPLLIAGIHPKTFQQFIDTLKEFLGTSDENVGLEKRIQEYQQSLSLIKSWVGEYDRLESSTLNSVTETISKNINFKPGEVLIPVVEAFKTEDGNSGIGRLRQLRIDIIGENKFKQHELKPTFGVIGNEAGNFLEPVKKAAGQLLARSRENKQKYWNGSAGLNMSHAWHSGRSANVALAAAFYCEMLKAEEQAEYFRLNPAICITGDIDKDGKVLSVENESLRLKAEAAFFSWAQAFVVPATQLNETLQYLHELNEEFPNRHLPVIGISHIQELFYDRRLTLHHKTDAITHNLKKIWKRKFSVVSAFIVIVLLGIIGRLVYGPVDRNPTYVTYEGEFAHIRNQTGSVLESINVGEAYVDYFNSTSKNEVADHLKFLDIDNDGINEILENNTAVLNSDKKESFIIRTVKNDTLFNKEFVLDVSFDKHPYVKKGVFGIRKFMVEDIENDGKQELVMILTYSAYFTNLLVVVDMGSQEITSMYVNAGYLRDIYVTDLDKDGFDDIVLATEFKGYREKGLVVLDSRFISGKGILGERYQKSDMEKAREKAVIFIPQTVLGRILSENDYNKGFEKGYPDYFGNFYKDMFTFFIRDWFESRGDGIGVLFEFYNDLSVRSIVSKDNYDIKAKELLDSGGINFEADGLFMDTYRDSLQYWNGVEFQYEPTLNKKYLEAVGDDSSFYKEFFFNTYN